MSALVIESFPDTLYARLKLTAAAHQRSLPQEAIHQLEKALATEQDSVLPPIEPRSYWANRRLLPEYEMLLSSGAFSGGTESSEMISEERDAR
ncbi:hypothetical protein EI77_04431 [Prosthecobacter fusiformis]|uniref:Antitoxin FitA-like ribbon-helix-helix domain-containing protein n=1 Tax=Prosthecobacter fusiformis TaxID=48464 RepID=A0A4R7RKD7_9BACT|nr:hypothetical protein [Prosthecobacter fusiformis]TDU63222.1 hypothetical protein EI77_04431 [Prosthecobacter fusiformis]